VQAFFTTSGTSLEIRTLEEEYSAYVWHLFKSHDHGFAATEKVSQMIELLNFWHGFHTM
jgi:hypothetical protein